MPEEVLVEAGWALGFAVEATTTPFTFDYVGDPASVSETVIDLNVEPGTYSVGDTREAFALYGERMKNSYGVVIDPCKPFN